MFECISTLFECMQGWFQKYFGDQHWWYFCRNRLSLDQETNHEKVQASSTSSAVALGGHGWLWFKILVLIKGCHCYFHCQVGLKKTTFLWVCVWNTPVFTFAQFHFAKHWQYNGYLPLHADFFLHLSGCLLTHFCGSMPFCSQLCGIVWKRWRRHSKDDGTSTLPSFFSGLQGAKKIFSPNIT